MTPAELETICAHAARLGGDVLLQKWGLRRTIEFKGGIDLVTDADKASEAAVLGFIQSRCPQDAILAEESGALGTQGAARRWHVDPLDGTTNYAHGIPHFAVNVAVEDGQGIVAAATLDPSRNELFTAARGLGARLNGVAIHTSTNTELSKSVLCTGFATDIHFDHDQALRLFTAYLLRSRAVRRFGAAALDLAWVACGRFDGFWEQKLKSWDIAAGILLVREAGGTVTNCEGGPPILSRGDVCAANVHLHPLLMEVMHEAIQG